MAFINKINKTRNENLSTTVIAHGTKINGDIESDATYIYGDFEGDIVSSSIVTVSTTGHVKGSIIAKTLVVSGLCEGTINCDIVDILDKGVIDGEVECSHLVIAKGGFLQGISRKKKAQSIETTIKAIENTNQQADESKGRQKTPKK